MSGENRKSRKPIWLKSAVLALLLVTSGFALAACQKPQSESQSVKQKEEQPANSNPKKSDEQLKEKQPTNSNPKKSNERLKENPPTNSNRKNSSQTKSKQKQDDAQDTQADDDPE